MTTKLEPFLGLDELDDTDVNWRISELLTDQANVLISAYRKTGKTSLILNLMAALTSEENFLGGLPCQELEGRLLYVNLELRQNMIINYWKEMRLDLDNEHVLFQDYRGKASKFMLADDEWRDDYIKALRKARVRALIIDPISPITSLQGVDANDNDMFRVSLEMLGEIGTEARLDHLFLVDHTGHADKTRARGASAREDWADILWNITADSQDTSYRTLVATGRGASGSQRYMRRDKQLTTLASKNTESDDSKKAQAVAYLASHADQTGEWITAEEAAAELDMSKKHVIEAWTEKEIMGSAARKRVGGNQPDKWHWGGL